MKVSVAIQLCKQRNLLSVLIREARALMHSICSTPGWAVKGHYYGLMSKRQQNFGKLKKRNKEGSKSAGG